MTIVDLRTKFLPKFVEGARERLERGRAHLAQGRTMALAREMQALAGEASLLAFHELSQVARTAEDANPGRLREVIRQITSAIVLDGQLDECKLTFADLEKIQGAMLRTLVVSRHQRVPYPGFDFNKRRGEATSGETRALRSS